MNTERLKGWLSSSSQLVAASAQLAKKQAELTTLNNVTFPRLYHAIGKRIVGSANLLPDLVPHREKIHELEASIAAKPEEPKPEPVAGFTAKAKQLAQQAATKAAKSTADAAAAIRIQTAYVSLGKQVVEQYATVIPDDLAHALADATAHQQNLESAIDALITPHVGRFFTPRRVVLATLGCVGVLVGVLLMPNSGVKSGNLPSALAKPDASKKSEAPSDPFSDEEIEKRTEARRAKWAETWGEYATAPTRSSSRDKVSIQDFYDLPRRAKMSQVIAAVGEPSRKKMPTGAEELIEWHYSAVPARYGVGSVFLYFDKFTERLSFIKDANGVQSRK